MNVFTQIALWDKITLLNLEMALFPEKQSVWLDWQRAEVKLSGKWRSSSSLFFKTMMHDETENLMDEKDVRIEMLILPNARNAWYESV